MLPVVSADTVYSFAQSMRETTHEEQADEFWKYLQETNPAMSEYILGFIETLESRKIRAFFINGVYTSVSLLKRQDDAEMLEKQFEL